MTIQKVLQCAASDLTRIANQDDPNTDELHLVANALSNLAEAIEEGKFGRPWPRPGGAPDLGLGGFYAGASSGASHTLEGSPTSDAERDPD